MKKNSVRPLRSAAAVISTTCASASAGDTGSDCLGTSNRHGAAPVHQFELLPQPPDARTADMPWPYWPMILQHLKLGEA